MTSSKTTADPDGRPVALITGGGTGIGAASAVELSSRGYRVVVCGRRLHKLESVAAETGAHPFEVDLTDPGRARDLVHDVAERFGRLDTIVLNAGTAIEGPFADLGDEQWSRTLSVNLESAARVVRLCLPMLMASRGSIVSVASIAALRAGTLMSAYSASKAGLVSLTQSLAVEYASAGVRANAVCPGWVRTEMADGELSGTMADHGLTIDEAYSRVTSLVPMRRAADPAEIARVVAFLACSESSYITGACIPVDGGATIADLGTLAL
ncbi:SDR family oxidoreductase [Rhodococcus fascians]|nr:SDR family oxidoreductase [Rhodococcus fascians]MBY4239445.1 SDR family oxidoreductase [Rhodococcus fascians]MBY4254972.1 SDR family oxidoreductase [Rhodococcus fascians]MBY4270801.1 SDR family oxidoreductase [Rhodococcus fascians]